MRHYRVDDVMDELRKKGFDMTTKEFLKTTLYQILKKYNIHEELDLNEYFELLRRLMDLCSENDLKNMGVSYYNENDFQFK